MNSTGHMTKMAAMLFNGKNLQKSKRPRYQVSVYRTIGPLVTFSKVILRLCSCVLSFALSIMFISKSS